MAIGIRALAMDMALAAALALAYRLGGTGRWCRNSFATDLGSTE